MSFQTDSPGTTMIFSILQHMLKYRFFLEEYGRGPPTVRLQPPETPLPESLSFWGAMLAICSGPLHHGAKKRQHMRHRRMSTCASLDFLRATSTVASMNSAHLPSCSDDRAFGLPPFLSTLLCNSPRVAFLLAHLKKTRRNAR